jgi:hypothetical protein
MNIRSKIRNGALLGGLAAVAATAWATNESMSNAIFAPPTYVAPERAAVTTSEPVTASDSLLQNESVVASDSLLQNESVVPSDAAAPVRERNMARTGITVEERRLSLDESLQAAVMDRLANNPRLSGKIGVESHDAVVTLSGYTSTVGQAWRAEREARGVTGVKYVQNQIRPRVGGSV